MIYVASSWRNPHYPGILDCLEQWNIAYYDWRDEEGFHWSEIFDNMIVGGIALHPPKVEHWTDPIPKEMYLQAMGTVRARAGFERDMKHLREAEALILLLPCGKSAHLEAGWAVGAGVPTALYIKEDLQPELMYGMMGEIFTDIHALMMWAKRNTKEEIRHVHA